MANLYYREDLDASDIVPGSLVEVSGDEGRHAVRVSRLRVGERTAIGDGAGALGEGAVESVAKDRFTVRIDRVVQSAPPAGPRLVLVQALAKGDRDELAVQAATELGVDAILPWQAARSVSRWDAAKAEKGRARWQTIVREASKQAIRARVPHVEPLATTAAIAGLAASATAWVNCWPAAANDRCRRPKAFRSCSSARSTCTS